MRTIAILCVLAVQAFGTHVAVADAKKTAGKRASKTRSCAGAGSTAVDEATRRKAIRAVLCLVNRERRAQRAPRLRRNKPLARAAREHSRALVEGKYFSHFSADGDLLRRISRVGYLRRHRDALLGETLTWGVAEGATPERLVAAFMASPPHRRTLLRRHFRDIGIGLALGAPATEVTDTAATLTLNFGRR